MLLNLTFVLGGLTLLNLALTSRLIYVEKSRDCIERYTCIIIEKVVIGHTLVCCTYCACVIAIKLVWTEDRPRIVEVL